MANTPTLDQLKATKAALLNVQAQIGKLIIDIDAAVVAIPTTAELQDLLSQLIDAAPKVIEAVNPTPVVVTPPVVTPPS